MTRALMLAWLIAAASPRAPMDPAWRQPFDPLRIVGNVYYVGTRGLSSFLIVTPAGGIIIDSGEAESVPFIRASVERLGFRLSDVKILLTGHAHFDPRVNPFVDRDGYQRFVAGAEQAYVNQLAAER